MEPYEAATVSDPLTRRCVSRSDGRPVVAEGSRTEVRINNGE
jgi:hypothetical protein